MSRRQSVLVTGASGFYGRHLVPYLAAKGHRVHAMTRTDPPFSATIPVIKASDIDTINWDRYLEDYTAVVHLAGLAHVATSIPEAEYDRINRHATARLARAAQQRNLQLIYVSSIAAQSGPSSDLTLTETDEPAPVSAYGRSKLAAERAIASQGSQFVIFRPTMTYGAHVSGNMQKLAAISLRQLPPPLGLIQNRRSILSVENMCEAMEFALSNDTVLGQTFLLADQEVVSVAEMVRCLREGAGYKTGGIPIPSTILETLFRVIGRYDMWQKIAGNLAVSIEKIERYGFKWKVNTTDGLRRLGKHYASSSHSFSRAH